MQRDTAARPRQKIIFIVSGSSGVGKTTLCKMVLDRGLDLNFSISFTTRPRRLGEQDGDNYHFLTPETFQEMIDRDGFVEWNEVHGYYYGTSREELERLLAERGDVLLEVDVGGASRVKACFQDRCVLIFIAPPRNEELRARLQKRGADSASGIEHRLQRVAEEAKMIGRYDYCVVNEDLEKAADVIESIVRAERCRTSRITNRDG